MLGILPFFHVFAMTVVMNLSVLCGLEIIALPRFDIKEALRVIHRKRPTCFPAVPAIYNAINHSAHLRRTDFGSLKICVAGGAPLPAEVRANFLKNTGLAVMEGYGLTEASPVVSMNPIAQGNRPGTIGQPVPGTTIELLDPDSGQPVGTGQPGRTVCTRAASDERVL